MEDRWCIKITEENQKIVGNYYDKQLGTDRAYSEDIVDWFLCSHNDDNKSILNAYEGMSLSFMNRGCDWSEPGREIFLEEFLKITNPTIKEEFYIDNIDVLNFLKR